MRPLHAVVVGAIALGLVAAGCGGAIPASNGGPATLRLTGSAGGRYLVDSRGQTVYLFEKDEKGESYCSGACEAVWPPLETKSMPNAGAGIDGTALGTIERDDGGLQVSYHGHPLYYYAADASTPGKTKGEDVDQFGAAWYVVGPGGKPVELESREHTGPGSGSNGGGSGGGGGGGGY